VVSDCTRVCAGALSRVKPRKIQTGNQVDGITGGLAVNDQDKDNK
jgi:hypothetical protein